MLARRSNVVPARIAEQAVRPPVATGVSGAGALLPGAVAMGAVAMGAVAIGAFAIGRLAIGRMALRSGHVGRLTIDDLTVGRPRVIEIADADPPNAVSFR